MNSTHTFLSSFEPYHRSHLSSQRPCFPSYFQIISPYFPPSPPICNVSYISCLPSLSSTLSKGIICPDSLLTHSFRAVCINTHTHTQNQSITWKQQSTHSSPQAAIKEISAHQVIKWSMGHVHTLTQTYIMSRHEICWKLCFLDTPHYITQAATTLWVPHSF